MQVKVKITTVKRAAQGTWDRFKTVLGIGKGKATYEGYVNEKDDTIFIEVTGSIKECFRVISNVQRFQKIKSTIIKNKLAKKGLKGMGATDMQLNQLEDMFDNDTNIEIIKEANAQELIEDQMSFWNKIKKTFKKVKQ